MLEIDEKAIYRLRDNLVLHSIVELNKYWLFDLENGDIFNINNVSTVVFSTLEKGCNVQTLVSEIINKFQVSKEEAEKDIKEILVLGLREGLIFKTGGMIS